MTNKITLADLLENQPDILKDAFKLIDKQGQLGVVERQAVDETLQALLNDDGLLEICRAYMDWKYPDSTGKSEDERTQEDILEFGADLDDDDDDEEDDAEFNRLLDIFIKETSKGFGEEEEKDSESGFELLCDLDENSAEYLVQECIEEIAPERGLYVHVDLVIPDTEEDELRVEVTTLRGTGMIQGWELASSLGRQPHSCGAANSRAGKDRVHRTDG